MSFLSKIFGRKGETRQAQQLDPAPPPHGAPAMMEVWDAYGRLMEIPREEWRTKVLPKNFQDVWQKPEELANLIHITLNDGFISDCLEPARQLHKIDPNPHRGATYLVVILLQLNKYEEAEKLIAGTIRKYGEDAILLTNLAKAKAGRGDDASAESTLWHALELDPNQENGFDWYVAIHRQRGGDPAANKAMHQIAALPGSWLAQLWLARSVLHSGELKQALAIYQECLTRLTKPVPSLFLMQMSGDLGKAGHLPEIIQLVEPYFDASIHGLKAGNNLIKAHIDLGQLDEARRILDSLYAQKRPDWKEVLSDWDTRISKARLSVMQSDEMPLKGTILALEGPVWLKPNSPIAELFPPKIDGSTKVAFLGGTRELEPDSQLVKRQMSDLPGRMSRALPLFLAEQVEFNTSARVQTLTPWIGGDSPGFFLGGMPWPDEMAVQHAQQCAIDCAYVVVTHIKPNSEPWKVELRLIRTGDNKCMGDLVVSFPQATPEAGIPNLTRQLLTALREKTEVRTIPTPPLYQIPEAASLGFYLLRLEQLLAVRCASMDGVPSDFLSGPREIIEGNLGLCLQCPQNVITRILLAQTLVAMKRVRPDILTEFRSKIALLQKEKPLSEPAHRIVQQLIDESMAG